MTRVHMQSIEMASLRLHVQRLLEEDLPRVLSILVLSYLRETYVHRLTWGTEGTKQGEFVNPEGVISLSLPSGSCEVFVVDMENHRIQVFDSEGKFLRMWGELGEREGQFKLPCGIASLPLPSGSCEIFVVDTENHRIQVFTPEGKFLRMWGKRGNKPGELCFPSNITSLPSGAIGNFSYCLAVADASNHRVQVFTPEGEFLRMWGTKGGEAGEFIYPVGIASLSLPSGSSEVLVTDTENHRIQVFDSEGKFLYMWGAEQGGAEDKLGEFNCPYGISVLPSGEVAVADTYNHRIQIFSLEEKGKLHIPPRCVCIWGAEQGGAGTKQGEFNHPYAVAAFYTSTGSSDEIIVTDKYNNRVSVFQPALD